MQNKTYKILCSLWLAFISLNAHAQCKIKISGQFCVFNAIQFTGNTSGSNHKWDMNGQGSVNNQAVALYSFNTSGTKKIVYTCTVNGQPCSDSVTIYVNPLPTVRQYQASASTDPCRPNDNICIRDSSFSTSGRQISWIQVLLDDGQLLKKTNPSTPQDFCFNYRGQSTNNFFVYSEIVDDSGCINKDTLTVALKKTVIPRPQYTFNLNSMCDSTSLTLNDTSTAKVSDFTSITWNWGDGTIDNLKAKAHKHTYTKSGNYQAIVYTENNLGCKDTFFVNVNVTRGLNDVIILASRDSVCIGGEITFSVDSIPPGAGRVSWILTTPDGKEVNMPGSWEQDVRFEQLGPQIIRLIYNNLNCQKVYRDTILVNGPNALIEEPHGRIDERQAYQCDFKDYYPVFFPNNSKYYHNDSHMLNDDKSYYDTVTKKIKHIFDPSKRNTLKAIGQERTYDPICLQRHWDFGDKYAYKCTTNYHLNINRFSNCNVSTQEEPVHVYKSWNLVKTYDFGARSIYETAFNTQNGTCFERPIYPADSFIYYSDSFIFVPASTQDSTDYLNLYAGEHVQYFAGKTFVGPGEERITSSVIIHIPTGQSLLISDSTNLPFNSLNGPRTLRLKKHQIIKTNTAGSFNFILGRVGFTNRLFKNYWTQYKNSHPLAKRISVAHVNKLKDFENSYKVDSLLFERLFQSEIIQCYKVRLQEKDTCSVLKCTSFDEETVSIMNPKAGGYRIRPIVTKPFCPIPIPDYKLDLDLTYLKPGCSAPLVFINKDSANPKSSFVYVNGRLDSSLYNKLGGATTSASISYVPGRDSFGYKTVGIIMTNGVGQFYNRPICRDTFWYHDLVNFQPPIFKLKIFDPVAKEGNYVHVCKGDDIYYHMHASKPYNLEDFNLHDYYFESPFTGRDKNLNYQEVIRDHMFWRTDLTIPEKHLTHSSHLLNDTKFWSSDSLAKMYSILRNKTIKKYYNYAVLSKQVGQQKHDECKNSTSVTPIITSDTILTGFATAFDTIIDLSKSREILETMAFYKGFETNNLTDKELIQLIWNGIGVINDPNTGSYGCLDTAGLNLSPFIKIKPRQRYVLHPRDTALVGYNHKEIGLDTLPSGVIRKKYLHSHRFTTKHNTGYLVSSISNYDNRCFKNDFARITSGFYHQIHFTDTILCSAAIDEFKFIPQIEYFSGTLPWYFGPEAQWANTQRQNDYKAGKKDREMPPIWDWNAFDNSTSPSTYNGSYPHGATGGILSSTDTIPISRFGTPPMYYSGDTGVYLFSSITMDSMGCRDTFSQNIYVIEPRPNFKNDFDITNCRNFVTLVDSSFFLEPWILAKNKCPNKQKPFIQKWVIEWGDTSQPSIFTREDFTKPGFPKSIGHLYEFRGEKAITLTITTENGCESSIVKKVKIPGPEPRFKFVGTDSNIIYLCLGDTAHFQNTTLKATPASQWKWEFGDGVFNNKSDTFQSYIYKAPGRYLIKLTQYDSIFVPPNIRAFCSGNFPADTNIFKMIAIVKDKEPIEGRLEEEILCPGQVQTFIDESSSAYNNYQWSAKGPNGQNIFFDTSGKQTKVSFRIPGQYQVIHNATFDLNWPPPKCSDEPDTLRFFVDSVIADFTIDTTLTPKICFTETSINSTTFRWGFYHNSDILKSGEKFNLDELTTGKTICNAYEQGGEIWICLVAENENGCRDTICKPVELNIFLYLANVFTPGNEDGKNDRYKFLVKGTEEFEVDIYNRWNEHVFHSEDKNYHWNGKVFNTGSQVPDGTYFYIFKYKFRGSKSKLVRGSVMVIRDK